MTALRAIGRFWAVWTAMCLVALVVWGAIAVMAPHGPPPAPAPLPHTGAGVLAWEHRGGLVPQRQVLANVHAIRYDLSRYVRDRSSAGYEGGNLSVAAQAGMASPPPVGRGYWTDGMSELRGAGNALIEGNVHAGQAMMTTGARLLHEAAQVRYHYTANAAKGTGS
jgi:hypothetical protein